MRGELEGKVAVVTGASSGIGKATAIKMAESGAKVVLAARREAESQEVVEQITGSGGEAIFVRTDASDEDDIRNLMATTVETYGRIDCAFNNAGRGDGTPLRWHEQDVEFYDQTEALNMRGVWLCMRHQLAQMVEQGSGAIVNNSSVAGLTGLPGPAYTATKHGVIGLTRTAAMHYGKYGIRVNVICPGVIDTPIIAGVPDEIGEQFRQRIPLGRSGTADEIAETVVFMCSDRASYMTGAAITVDGGIMQGIVHGILDK